MDIRFTGAVDGIYAALRRKSPNSTVVMWELILYFVPRKDLNSHHIETASVIETGTSSRLLVQLGPDHT